MTEYTREMHEAYRRQQDEQAAREDRERRASGEKANAYAAWVADGGSAADFEREWPKLRGELRSRRIMDADERAREAQRRAGTSRI